MAVNMNIIRFWTDVWTILAICYPALRELNFQWHLIDWATNWFIKNIRNVRKKRSVDVEIVTIKNIVTFIVTWVYYDFVHIFASMAVPVNCGCPCPGTSGGTGCWRSFDLWVLATSCSFYSALSLPWPTSTVRRSSKKETSSLRAFSSRTVNCEWKPVK